VSEILLEFDLVSDVLGEATEGINVPITGEANGNISSFAGYVINEHSGM